MNNEMPNNWVRPPEWLPEQRSVTDHRIGTREEWAAVRDELLAREKEHTRLGDELARQRRELPWVRVEKEYCLDTDEGPRALAEVSTATFSRPSGRRSQVDMGVAASSS